MPRIPYQSEVSARSLRSSGNTINTRVNPDAYGAGIAQAMQEGAQGIRRAAGAVDELAMQEVERKRKEQVANTIAQSDYTRRELELRNEVGADGKGYQDRVVQDYRNFVEDTVKDIEDDHVRSTVRLKMLEDEANISSRAAQYEMSLRAEDSKRQADVSLNSLQNKISSDPSRYDAYVAQGEEVIAARPNVTESLRAGMKQSWRYDSAKRRFEGMLANAKTREDYNTIAAELAGKGGRDWTAEIMPEDYKQIMNTLGNGVKAFNTRADSDAKAVLDSAEEQTKALRNIPADELAVVQTTAKQSDDPSVQTRMARLVRDQNLLREGQRLPPHELQAQINAVQGNPGLAYPDLPPVVSEAVNEAGQKFGVSAGFLGAVAHREYGQYFKVDRTPANEKFKPQALSGDLDLRNVRNDVVYAATSAGEALGAPLMLVKGKGNDPTGVNISTVGMSSEQKAQLASSLVDAGFTGFSEYDTYMRADMRGSVAQNFGTEKDGKVWGGWTWLSPEIVKTLKDKGFAAGADAATIKRSAKTSTKQIDYAKSTGIVDETGKPTSSAMGVFQFTKGTWLDTVRDPSVAAALGIDPMKTSEEALLAMRGDPRASTIAAAAYATKNKKTMENSLGREVSDAELYMAHFMGAGAAISFINAYKNNPQQDATALLPETAKANKPVFYNNGKARTVQEVYSNIAQDFNIAPSRVAYDDNQMRERMLKQAQSELKTDPVAHAAKVGSHTIIPLDQEGAFSSRGATSRAIADYYRIPMRDMKPFTEEETAWIKSRIDDNDPEQSVQLFAEIQNMGSEPAKAAMKQIEAKDAVFAHAGDLYLEGSPSVATDIIRGRKMLEENKALKDSLGPDSDVNSAFNSVTGGALYDIEPARRQAIQDAALAYYVQSSARSGKTISFKSSDFKKSVQAVMGARSGENVIDDVNGYKTLLPKNVSADMMEQALSRMTMDDYIKMSATGEPPRYADGTVVDPYDIRDEVMLRYVGGNQYRLMLDDGTVLTTGNRTANGRAQAYLFKPEAETLQRVLSRPTSGPITYSSLNGGMIK